MRSTLHALSPLDGRYHTKTQELAAIFCEESLIKHRTLIEILWFVKVRSILSAKWELPKLSPDMERILKSCVNNFAESDAERVKELEKITAHDVKAVEYFLREKFKTHDALEADICLLHFGVTSEDINNLAYAYMMKRGLCECIIPWLEEIQDALRNFSHDYADTAMLGHTHGQTATPTTFGKEIANFFVRLSKQLDKLKNLPIEGKLNGATGNLNALYQAVPEIDWENVSQQFVESFGFTWNPYTTQIEPHDFLVDIFDTTHHINAIMLGMSKDIWQYYSMGYFAIESQGTEVGSSIMPHKINPIDFENAEANLGIANALLKHFSEKLPISRLQRDLSDSSVMRNIGSAFGYAVIAYSSIVKGFEKLLCNKNKLAEDLDSHWEVLTEAVQTEMRTHHISDAYERLKLFARGNPVDKSSLHEFIDQQQIPEESKTKLKTLTPATYTGAASSLARKI